MPKTYHVLIDDNPRLLVTLQNYLTQLDSGSNFCDGRNPEVVFVAHNPIPVMLRHGSARSARGQRTYSAAMYVWVVADATALSYAREALRDGYVEEILDLQQSEGFVKADLRRFLGF